MQNFKNLFLNSNKTQRRIFNYLFFIVAFTGIFVSEINPVIGNDILLFLQAVFIFYYYRNSTLQTDTLAAYQNNKPIYNLFMLWLVASFISLVFSPILISLHAVLAQIPRFLGSIVNVAFAYTLFHYIKSQKVNPWILLFIIVFGASLAGVNFFFIWNLYPIARVDSNFLLNPPFYINIRQAGFHANAAICIVVAYLYRNDLSKNKNVLMYLLLTLLWTYLFWTGGRASSFSMIFSFYAGIAVLFLCKQKAFTFLISISVPMLVGIILAEFFAVLPNTGLLSLFERNITSDVNAMSGGRIAIWKASLLALENNWLFGLGAESYMFLRDSNGNLLFSTHPHNVIVQFLVEWGLLGFLLASTFLSVLFFKGFKLLVNDIKSNHNQAALRLFCFMLIISFSITGLVDGTYYHAQTVMCLLLAFTVWLLPEDFLKQN